MNYEKVKEMLPERRRWCKYINCIYLQRWRGAVRIRYGYRYRHSQVIGTWYPDGRFKFSVLCYYPSQRTAINGFMPDGYQVHSHRYYSFLWRPGQDIDDSLAFYIREDREGLARSNRFNKAGGRITIHPHGKVSGRFSTSFGVIRNELKRGDISRDLPRRRGRYWLRKARGIYRENICGKSYYEGCAWKKIWPKPTTEWTGDCGCHVYTKKARSRDTVASIMAEENATVRTAKIQIYGIEKFFTDAGAKQIDKEAGYELVTLDTGLANQEPDRWGRRQATANVVLTALRMECSTTGKVYVNTVPPTMRMVRQALDWMFDLPNYLGRIGKQT
jgi:hypothetical protein